MILGFKPQFVDPILKGTKIHTLRDDLKDRWKKGNTIHAATGTRTPNYNMFHLDVCRGVEYCRIDFKTNLIVLSIGPQHTEDVFYFTNQLTDLNEFAINDGFKDWQDFKGFWNTDGIIRMKIIHWTNFTYKERHKLKVIID